jgi:hypothetical protein
MFFQLELFVPIIALYRPLLGNGLSWFYLHYWFLALDIDQSIFISTTCCVFHEKISAGSCVSTNCLVYCVNIFCKIMCINCLLRVSCKGICRIMCIKFLLRVHTYCVKVFAGTCFSTTCWVYVLCKGIYKIICINYLLGVQSKGI